MEGLSDSAILQRAGDSARRTAARLSADTHDLSTAEDPSLKAAADEAIAALNRLSDVLQKEMT